MATPVKFTLIAVLLVLPALAVANSLCFSPVKEKNGDKDTERSFWQSFDYKVQVDNGPIVVPSEDSSTLYEFTTEALLVKVWLGDKIVESFRVRREWLEAGRNCIYFKNIYETWSVVEKWQGERLCSCSQ